MRDRAEGIDEVGFVADFADDGVIGVDVDDVLKVLRGELAISHEYGFRCNFDKMVLHPLAGRQFTGDVSDFERLGIKVDSSGNLKFMQVPIVGMMVLSPSGCRIRWELSGRYCSG